jgi:hypothetical protein
MKAIMSKTITCSCTWKKVWTLEPDGLRKSSCQRSCGCESRPPTQGLRRHYDTHLMVTQGTRVPTVAPTAQAKGMVEMPRAILDASVISANTLFMTPMLPFSAPARNRLFDDMMKRKISQIDEALPHSQCPNCSG